MDTSIIVNKTDVKNIRNVLKKYKDNEVVNIYSSKMDELDKLIWQGGLRIKAVHFHKDIDLMLIVLNNKKIIQRSISDFASLKNAKISHLNNYQLIGKGTGIHWPNLDEDLSLKGFLRHEISQSFGSSNHSLVA